MKGRKVGIRIQDKIEKLGTKEKSFSLKKLPFSIDEFLFRIHFHSHSGHKLKFHTFFISLAVLFERVRRRRLFIHSTLRRFENFVAKKSFFLFASEKKGFSFWNNKVFNSFLVSFYISDVKRNLFYLLEQNILESN